MKLKNVDLTKLGAAVVEAPDAHRAVAARAARHARRTTGAFKDRLDVTSERSLDDLEDMLELQEDAEGKLVSKIPLKDRIAINRELMRHHSYITSMKRQNVAPIIVQIERQQINIARETEEAALRLAGAAPKLIEAQRVERGSD